MEDGTLGYFEQLARASVDLFGNRATLPVASAVARLGATTVQGPDAQRALSGQLPANKVLEALERLCRLGALHEMPYVGRPHARTFEIRGESCVWPFIRAFVEELTSESAPETHGGDASAQR